MKRTLGVDGWMESTRTRREEKRTFADEVKNLRASREELAVALTMERRPAQGVAWFEFSYCYELRNHGLCRQNRSALWWIFASIHGVDEN